MAADIRLTKTSASIVLLMVVLAFSIVFLSQSSFSFSQGPNNRNVSIDTRVNITGSAPVVYKVSPTPNVVLSAGHTLSVYCNATIRDYNGYADIANVSAVFFHSTSTLGAADNNNTHYTNASCAQISGEQDTYYSNYSCIFPMEYYALNGTWNCTVFVNDTGGLKGNFSNTTTINPLYALNVTTLLDFGNISADEYSTNQTANVTNLGNLPINVSVYGYGRTAGDNLSFVCDQGNLSVNLLRYSANASDDYAQKQILNATAKNISGFTIPKTTNTSFSVNSTYWQLYADPNQVAFGQCNGTVVFRAEPA